MGNNSIRIEVVDVKTNGYLTKVWKIIERGLKWLKRKLI